MIAHLLLSLLLAINLTELDSELLLREQYDDAKQSRIAALHRSDIPEADRLIALICEYESYNYDTAYFYTEQLLDYATTTNDTVLRTTALLRRAFIYMSGGLFKESYDLFRSIDPETLDTEQRIYYHSVMARLCYDMADYASGELTYRYDQEGAIQSEQAMALISPSDTVRYWMAAALYSVKIKNYPQSIDRFRLALQGSQITDHEKAICYSSMAYPLLTMGQEDESDRCLVLAAISDLRSSTKEATALAVLAERLINQGDIAHAGQYIRQAQADAASYNARLRQLSISRILPIIEQEQLEQELAARHKVVALVLAIVALAVILIIALAVLYYRNRALNRARRLISLTNQRLEEANRIKEGYIGSCLSRESDLFVELERYQNYVTKRAKEHNTEELRFVPPYIDARNKRREFEKDFDRLFLNIFPNFVTEFNALLRPEEAIAPKAGELLNTELRIFALIRLGITDNDKLARVLDYSVNTIYTYKTRVHNRSSLSNDEFYQRLQKISI